MKKIIFVVTAIALNLLLPSTLAARQVRLGGIIVGMQPRLTGTSSGLRAVGQSSDRDTSIHIEGFYRYRVTDNISRTPGLIWLSAPDRDNSNKDIEDIIVTIAVLFDF